MKLLDDAVMQHSLEKGGRFRVLSDAEVAALGEYLSLSNEDTTKPPRIRIAPRSDGINPLDGRFGPDRVAIRQGKIFTGRDLT